MKNLSKKFEDIMAAVAFAEEGEFDTAKEILKEQRKILLAFTGEDSDTTAFGYALNVCKRIGAELDILYVASKGLLSSKIKKLADALKKEGINYRLSQKTGCLRNQIIDYTRANKGILFVVIESSDNLEVDCRRQNKKLSDIWKNLKCPLVVVSELEKA